MKNKLKKIFAMALTIIIVCLLIIFSFIDIFEKNDKTEEDETGILNTISNFWGGFLNILGIGGEIEMQGEITELENIKAIYVYSQDYNSPNVKKLADSGINTLLLSDSSLLPDYNPRGIIPEQIKNYSKIAKDENISVFFAISFSDKSTKFEQTVLSTGQEIAHTSPWDENYWKNLTEITKGLANLSLNDSYSISGVWIDFELYELGGGKYFNESWGFEDSVFNRYFISRGIANPGVSRLERYSWLQTNGKLDDYYLFLHQEIKRLAKNYKDEVKSINPNFLIGGYPSPFPNLMYLNDIFSSWSSINDPAVVWGIETYGYSSGGSTKIPAGIENKKINDYYNLTEYYYNSSEYYGDEIYAYYVSGFLTNRYRIEDIFGNYSDALARTNGYWVFTSYSLVRNCTSLSSSDVAGYRLPVNCENDFRNPGCCKNPFLLSSSQWESDCCPYYENGKEKYLQEIRKVNLGFCGNGVCDNGENLDNCARDCLDTKINIIPQPQKIEIVPYDSINLDSSWKIYADLNDEYENFTANYLNNKTLENSSGNINLQVDDIVGVVNENRIIIGNPNTNPIIKNIAESNGINFNQEITKGFNQGYILSIKPGEILILANSTAGTFYGMISLLWLLNYNAQSNQIILPNVKITDWPDLEIRGFFVGTRKGYYSTDQEFIDRLTKYKYNSWVNSLPAIWPATSTSAIQNEINLKKYMDLRHFYIIASVEPSYVNWLDSNGNPLGNINPNHWEGIYAENVSLRFNSSNYAVSTEPELQLNNSGFEIDSNSDTIPDYWTYEPGREYPISEDNWTRDCNEKYSGSCSMKLSLSKNLSGVNSSSYLESGLYNLKPNRIYYLSFWAKKKENSAHRYNPQVTCSVIANGITTSSPSAMVDGGNSWENYYFTISTFNNESEMYCWSRAQATNSLEMWLDDISIIDVTNKLSNIIKTNSTRLHVYNIDKTIEYTEGIDYILETAGNFNYANPLEGNITSIKRLNNGNIPAESEIKVDYDFVMSILQDRGESPSFSEPILLSLYDHYILKPTMENLNPDYIYIGLDEIRGFNRDSRAKKQGLENYQVLANFVNNISRLAKKYDANVKVLMWNDMISPFHNGGYENYQVEYGGQKGKTWYTLDLLDRNIIPISWWYDANDHSHAVSKTAELLNVMNFSYTVAPFNTPQNIRWWSYISYKSKAWGMIDTEWYNNPSGLVESANYSWNAIKSYTEECNPDYLEICNGKDDDCDNIYPVPNRPWEFLNWSSNIDEGFNLTMDQFNCGSCGNICYYPKGHASCSNGQCQFNGCYKGYYNLDGDISNGCECDNPNSCKTNPSSSSSSSDSGSRTSSNTRTPTSAPGFTIPYWDNDNISQDIQPETPLPINNINKTRFIEFIKRNLIWEIGIGIVVVAILIIILLAIKRSRRKHKRLYEIMNLKGAIISAKIRINEFRRLGYSDKEIKNRFILNGWNKRVVEKIFDELNKNQ